MEPKVSPSAAVTLMPMNSDLELNSCLYKSVITLKCGLQGKNMILLSYAVVMLLYQPHSNQVIQYSWYLVNTSYCNSTGN